MTEFEERVRSIEKKLREGDRIISHQNVLYRELESGDRLMAKDLIINVNPYVINNLMVDKVTNTNAYARGTKYPTTYDRKNFRPRKEYSGFNRYYVVRKIEK
jgi:hypothetical protein